MTKDFEKKPGFIYIDSEELQQVVAISKKTGKAYCQDGTEYSAAEVQILRKIGGINREVHLIKGAFKGQIVELKHEN